MLVPGRGAKPKYPWPKWEDGEEHTIAQGEDFTISVVNFVASLHMRARSRGIKCVTQTEGNKIRFQFYTPEENN